MAAATAPVSPATRRGAAVVGASMLLVGLAIAVRVLTWAGLDWAVLSTTGRTAPVDRVVGLLAVLVGWLTVGWFALALLLALVSMVPGWLGATAHVAARRVTPSLVRHVVAVALGVGVAATTAASSAYALPDRPDTHVDPTWAAAAVALPNLDRPIGQVVGDGPPSATRDILVRAGDCLWTIAAKRLGAAASDAEIDAEWRRWYAANRALIGPDPDLIRPGQRLVAP